MVYSIYVLYRLYGLFGNLNDIAWPVFLLRAIAIVIAWTFFGSVLGAFVGVAQKIIHKLRKPLPMTSR